MHPEGPFDRLRDFLEQRRLQPDINRGLRATVGFMAPVLVALWWNLPIEAALAAIAAQNIAMVDIRGSYPLRLSLLLAMTAILSGATWLGGLGGASLPLALLVIAIVTLASGVWRHVSPDYGPSLANTSIFLALLATALAGGETMASRHFLSALVGGLWGVLVQVALWPFRAQHPLRRVVSDSWLALSDLVAAMDPSTPMDATARHQKVTECEALLRTTLDQATATLTAQSRRRRAHLGELDELNLTAARFGTRLTALNTVLESVLAQPDFAALPPAFGPVFTTLHNTTRTVAVTLVSRQPAHLAAAEVRVLRLGNLLRSVRQRLAAQVAQAPTATQLMGLLDQLAELLPATEAALRATVERTNEHVAFSLELFDLKTWTLRPLASALSFHWPPDPALVRFIFRLTLLQVLGVAVMNYFALSRGYWLPLTVLVILQPDYGTTRLRAGQRALGTVIGGLLASALLWLPTPVPVLFGAMALTMFFFAFWLKRNYGIAVVFITIFVVIITETSGPVTLAFTGERLLSTLAGAVAALVAAHFFWPVWERDLFPKIVARALLANRDYLAKITAALATGQPYAGDVVDTKRAAQTANSALFTSLQRMTADPEHRRTELEAAAALANGNQRLTRSLTVVALHLGGPPLPEADFAPFAHAAADALEALAEDSAAGHVDVARIAALRAQLDSIRLPTATDPGKQAALGEFGRCVTELGAMLLAAPDALFERRAGAAAGS